MASHPAMTGASAPNGETLVYTYGMKPWVAFLVILFFGACAAILADMALYGSRGLILEHFIVLSPEAARIIYWLLAAVSLGFVAIGLWAIVERFQSPRSVVLGPNELTAPPSALARSRQEIPYASIHGLRLGGTARHPFVTVDHATGKLSIMGRLLPSKAAFEEVVRELQRRTGRAA